MRPLSLLVFFCGVYLLAIHTVQAQDMKPAVPCQSLMKVDLQDIGGAGSSVTEARETTSDGIKVCSVQGTLAPEITFQLLLPLETWTGRYLQVGCGGLCGNITLRSGASDGCQMLTDGGFAMAATDMGHSSTDGSWGLDDQRRADFAYRAQHVTAIAAKKLIKMFYGRSENYSYFNGCSDGGREALAEAQRYPHDFNGIIAGAPAMLFQVQNTLYHGWQAVSNTDENGKVILTSARLPLLYRAVLAACDHLDGVKDGLIANPAACSFDPQTLQCTEDTSNTDTCLTQAEVDVAAKFYQGPKDEKSGAYLTAGQPLYGSELAWQGVYVADTPDGHLMSETAAVPVLRYLAFTQPDASRTLSDLEFSEKTLNNLRTRHYLFDATNTNLHAYAQNGHKLILWHGMADPHISPSNTVAYHKALLRDMGEENVYAFERLYLLPGVAHCGGGQGPSKIDLLTPLIQWVEGGLAPHAIMTASTSDTSNFGQPDFADKKEQQKHMPPMMSFDVPPLPDMVRPVYPYPNSSHYVGTGSLYDAQNWQKGMAVETVPTRNWPGEDLFGGYDFIAN